jgi:3-methyladenine DNA glycosylase AlkC
MATAPLRPLLKDQLFNADTLRLLSEPLAKQVPHFDATAFTRQVLAGFGARELSERIVWIREQLRQFLPSDYRKAVALILQALPEPCDPTLSDDDFGHFIYAPYADFVAHYGCQIDELEFSLRALKTITTRFSAEFAVRPFLVAFPEQTLRYLSDWAQDPHYHVRRWVSEGTRPKLPWGKAVRLSWEQCVPLLNALHADPTRFVQRSVANHLNDWSKTHPEQVLHCLREWKMHAQANEKALDYMTRHSLRTLVKQGHREALHLLGYASQAYTLNGLSFSPRVCLGEALSFSFVLTSQAETPQRFAVDYVLFYRNKKGALTPKVYKLKQCFLAPGESLTLRKQLVLKPRSTRTLYLGTHGFALQVNGCQTEPSTFELYDTLN